MSEERKDTTAFAEAGEKTLPSGVVLDKDGKPCRTCTSSSAWKAMMKGTMNTSATRPTASSSSSSPNTASPASTSPSASPASSITSSTWPAAAPAPVECPPDVEQLGRSTWTLLHSIAASYPEHPTADQRSDLLGFVKLFSKLYPCWSCAEDFRGYIAREQPRVEGRGPFGMWLCGAHNDVNRKLGKKEFDCSRWEERWRTGWKDGSCD